MSPARRRRERTARKQAKRQREAAAGNRAHRAARFIVDSRWVPGNLKDVTPGRFQLVPYAGREETA